MPIGHGHFDYFSPKLSFAAAGTDADFTGDKVLLHQHCRSDASFSDGWSKSLDEGEYDVADGDFVNDDASALYVPAGFKVTLHEHGKADSRFADGGTKEYWGPVSVDCLADDDINDWTSHITVEKFVPCADKNQEDAAKPGDCGDCLAGFVVDAASGTCIPEESSDDGTDDGTTDTSPIAPAAIVEPTQPSKTALLPILGLVVIGGVILSMSPE